MQSALAVKIEDAREKLRPAVQKIFNDDFMVGLAAVLAAVVILPMFFSFTPTMLAIFDAVNYIIIALFIAEYVLETFVAESRLGYITDLWHVLDLFIIILAVLDISKLSLIPFMVGQGRISPVLRLLRVLFALTIAGRTVERAMPERPQKKTDPLPSKLEIVCLDKEGKISMCSMKDSVCTLVTNNAPVWIDMQNIGERDLDFITEAIKIPRYILESKLIGESFPKIDYFKNFTSIFLWDSRLVPEGPGSTGIKNFNIVRNGMLVIYEDARIFTLSTGRSDLFDRIHGDGWVLEGNLAARVLYSILRRKIRDYEEIVRAIEYKTLQLEEIPGNKTSPKFLEETFHFKKEIQNTVNNLWHFKQVLRYARTNKVVLRGIRDEHLPYLDILYGEVEYMYETALNIRESLISLIELHINTVSYDINRVMRVLAVITCLAIIPAVIGGLLGVNLVDNPYDLRISEVFFIVLSLMLLGTYAFYKMDWLK